MTVFAYFLSASAKNLFMQENWTLGFVLMQLWDFAKLLDKVWGDSYTRFLTLDFKFHFILLKVNGKCSKK